MLEKINYKNLFTRTNLFIAVFGILPAAGYLIGISFYQGRLSAYGVVSDTFPLALQDIYVEAFWAVGLWLLNLATMLAAIVNKMFLPPGLYWFIGSLVSITFIVYFLIKHKSTIGLFMHEKLQPAKKIFDYLDYEKNAFTKAMDITGSFSYLFASILLVVMLIAICWVGMPLLAYYQGRDQATKTISSYLEKGCYVRDGERWSNCKKLIGNNGQLIYEGILVADTNGYVAFFNKTGSYVTKFPENTVIVSSLPE